MNFARCFFIVIACLVALIQINAAPAPRWKPFKKLEKVGRNIRNGIIKAGPAVQVVGEAATIYKGGK